MNNKIFTSAPLWANGIVIIRVFTGMLIIMYGKEIFEEGVMNDYTHFLSDVGFPAPGFMAHFAKVTEIVGGVMLILGLFTRLVTVPLMIIMMVVIRYMAGGSFFNGGTASDFFLLFLLFFLMGSGKYSLDYLLFDRKKAIETA
ncbi:DoxX family protein [Flavobacterium psychrotrophum]|uniref:DoxX family protein n=1 Tax=Flavobacterium psychrotrophum TaxID=2294119 RepID=UPI000E31AF70|nr:DoxX family protein [Flavobacterium psychrotrophum]